MASTSTTVRGGCAGRALPVWRWLDIRALSQLLLSRLVRWPGAVLERVVYCTAVIDAASNPSGFADQDIYLKALATSGSVDTSSTAHMSRE